VQVLLDNRVLEEVLKSHCCNVVYSQD
jgi:hypothetical protein